MVPFALCGCGDGGGGGGKSVSKKSTVIIMRHCLRATAGNQVSANADFTFDNNYSKDPWPEFEVPAYHCLPRGEDVVISQGQWWRARGGFDKPLRMIADLLPENNGQRDNVTMHRFMEGLGMEESLSPDVSISLDHGPFGTVDTPACADAKPSEAKLKADVLEHMDANPPPREYHGAMQRLFEVMGQGAAGNWTGLKCGVTTLPPSGIPMPSGGCDAGAVFSERLLMEWGSGNMKVGWGRVGLEEIPRLFLLEMWYFFNWFAPATVHRYFGASIIRTVMRSLDDEGTTIFVGHDSDMMKLKGALGLTWDPAPFPSNSTLPGSMLRFVRDGDEVSVSYMYVANFSSDSGEMLSVDARFLPSASSKMAFSDVTDLLRKGSIEACDPAAAAADAAAKEAPVVQVV